MMKVCLFLCLALSGHDKAWSFQLQHAPPATRKRSTSSKLWAAASDNNHTDKDNTMDSYNNAVKRFQIMQPDGIRWIHDDRHRENNTVVMPQPQPPKQQDEPPPTNGRQQGKQYATDDHTMSAYLNAMSKASVRNKNKNNNNNNNNNNVAGKEKGPVVVDDVNNKPTGMSMEEQVDFASKSYFEEMAEMQRQHVSAEEEHVVHASKAYFDELANLEQQQEEEIASLLLGQDNSKIEGGEQEKPMAATALEEEEEATAARHTTQVGPSTILPQIDPNTYASILSGITTTDSQKVATPKAIVEPSILEQDTKTCTVNEKRPTSSLSTHEEDAKETRKQDMTLRLPVVDSVVEELAPPPETPVEATAVLSPNKDAYIYKKKILEEKVEQETVSSLEKAVTKETTLDDPLAVALEEETTIPTVQQPSRSQDETNDFPTSAVMDVDPVEEEEIPLNIPDNNDDDNAATETTAADVITQEIDRLEELTQAYGKQAEQQLQDLTKKMETEVMVRMGGQVIIPGEDILPEECSSRDKLMEEAMKRYLESPAQMEEAEIPENAPVITVDALSSKTTSKPVVAEFSKKALETESTATTRMDEQEKIDPSVPRDMATEDPVPLMSEKLPTAMKEDPVALRGHRSTAPKADERKKQEHSPTSIASSTREKETEDPKSLAKKKQLDFAIKNAIETLDPAEKRRTERHCLERQLRMDRAMTNYMGEMTQIEQISGRPMAPLEKTEEATLGEASDVSGAETEEVVSEVKERSEVPTLKAHSSEIDVAEAKLQISSSEESEQKETMVLEKDRVESTLTKNAPQVEREMKRPLVVPIKSEGSNDGSSAYDRLTKDPPVTNHRALPLSEALLHGFDDELANVKKWLKEKEPIKAETEAAALAPENSATSLGDGIVYLSKLSAEEKSELETVEAEAATKEAENTATSLDDGIVYLAKLSTEEKSELETVEAEAATKEAKNTATALDDGIEYLAKLSTEEKSELETVEAEAATKEAENTAVSLLDDQIAALAKLFDKGEDFLNAVEYEETLPEQATRTLIGRMEERAEEHSTSLEAIETLLANASALNAEIEVGTTSSLCVEVEDIAVGLSKNEIETHAASPDSAKKLPESTTNGLDAEIEGIGFSYLEEMMAADLKSSDDATTTESSIERALIDYATALAQLEAEANESSGDEAPSASSDKVEESEIDEELSLSLMSMEGEGTSRMTPPVSSMSEKELIAQIDKAMEEYNEAMELFEEDTELQEVVQNSLKEMAEHVAEGQESTVEDSIFGNEESYQPYERRVTQDKTNDPDPFLTNINEPTMLMMNLKAEKVGSASTTDDPSIMVSNDADSVESVLQDKPDLSSNLWNRAAGFSPKKLTAPIKTEEALAAKAKNTKPLIAFAREKSSVTEQILKKTEIAKE